MNMLILAPIIGGQNTERSRCVSAGGYVGGPPRIDNCPLGETLGLG